MFAYISGSPFVLIELHGVPPRAHGWVFGLNALGLITASHLNRRLLAAWRAEAVLSVATTATAALSVALLLVAVSGLGGLVGLLIPMFGYVASLGFTQPNALAGAMAPHPERAGSAAALYGTLQFLAAGAGRRPGRRAARRHRGPMAAVMAGCGVLALGFHRALVGRPARRMA